MSIPHETFQIEDKILLSTLAGTEKYLVQQADGTFRHVVGSDIATQGFVNTVFVSTESDFPTAVAGVITFAENTVYVMLDTVTTANRIVLSTTGGISALGGGVGNLIYTGTGTFLTGSAIDRFTINNVVFFATTAGAVLFSITGAPVVFPAFFILETISFVGFTNLGIITAVSLRMGNTGFINFGQGLSITGSLVCQIIGGLYTNVVAATTPYITFSGVHDLIQVKDCNMDTIATEEVIFIDPAITITEGVITGNVFRNSTADWFGAGSLTENDVRFEYASNGDAPESDESANICITAAVAETVVPTVFEKIAGTYGANILNRFTHSLGTLTYTGRKTRTFQVTCSASITTSNNNRNVQIALAKNGTAIAASKQERKMATGADIGNMTIVYEVELSTGDTVEGQYTTVATGTDITTSFLNFIIN